MHARVTHNPARSSDEFSLYSLRLDYDFGGATLTSVTSYYERDVRTTTEWDPGTVFFLDLVYGLLVNIDPRYPGNPSPCTRDRGCALRLV